MSCVIASIRRSRNWTEITLCTSILEKKNHEIILIRRHTSDPTNIFLISPSSFVQRSRSHDAVFSAQMRQSVKYNYPTTIMSGIILSEFISLHLIHYCCFGISPSSGRKMYDKKLCAIGKLILKLVSCTSERLLAHVWKIWIYKMFLLHQRYSWRIFQRQSQSVFYGLLDHSLR